MEIKPVFHNNTFQTNFEGRVKTSFDSVPERIQELKDMVEDVILDYKFNKDPVKTYKLAVQLDLQMNKFFDNMNDYKLDENDIHTLTEVCRRINEDPFLEEIRERGCNSMLNEEKSKANIVHNVKSSALPEVTAQVEYNRGEKTIIPSPEKSAASPDKNQEQEQPIAFFTNNPDFILKQVNNAIESKIPEEEKNNTIPFSILQTQNINDHQKPERDLRRENIEKVKEQFLKLVSKMHEEYEEHRIEDSYEYKNKAVEFAHANNTESELQEFFNIQLEKNKKEMAELDTWNQHIHKVVEELEDDKGYTVEKGKKAYKLSYKLRPDGKVAMKMDGTLDMPLFNILSLMYEPDGFNHWVPFCADARLIKPLHRAAHTYWLRYGLPILTDRECYCYGIGVDRLNRNGSILAISRKIHDDPAFCEQYGIEIPAKSKYVKMDIDVGMEIIPISRQKIQLKLVTTVDPNVKNTPPAILSWISRKASQHLFDKLIKKAKNLKGTLWEKRIQENKEFYGWLEAKVNTFLDEHKLNE